MRTTLASFTWVALCSCDGCKDKYEPDTGHVWETGETGTDDTDDTGDVVQDCTVAVDEFEPESGTTNVYYRAPLVVTFTGAAPGAEFELTDADSNVIPLEEVWSDGDLQVTLTAPGGFTPGSEHILSVSICEETALAGFTTSSLGEPLALEPSELVGLTYNFALDDADITKPAGIGMLIGMYLTAPILIGIESADKSMIDLLGARGLVQADGDVVQNTTTAHWDFPAADFTTSPYFSAESDEVVLDYDGTDLIFHNFSIEGTFAVDASYIGGGVVEADVDTRSMGPLLNLEDREDAVCTYLAKMGLECEACPDGEPYCMFLRAEFEDAELIEGIALRRIEICDNGIDDDEDGDVDCDDHGCLLDPACAR